VTAEVKIGQKQAEVKLNDSPANVRVAHLFTGHLQLVCEDITMQQINKQTSTATSFGASTESGYNDRINGETRPTMGTIHKLSTPPP
jgi:hypothetical protein